MSYELHMEKIGGVYMPAFYYFVPRLGQKRIPYEGVLIFLDCFMDPMRLEYLKWSTTGFAKHCPGAEWVHPEYTAETMLDIKDPPFTPIDARSFAQIMGGCCPEDYLPEHPRDILKRR